MFSANTRQSPGTEAWDACWGIELSSAAYSTGRQGLKYLQEHKENSPKAVPSLVHCLLRLSLLRAEVRGPARSSTWSCVGHTTRLVCAASGQGELGSLLHLVLWEGTVGKEIAHYHRCLNVNFAVFPCLLLTCVCCTSGSLFPVKKVPRYRRHLWKSSGVYMEKQILLYNRKSARISLHWLSSSLALPAYKLGTISMED